MTRKQRFLTAVRLGVPDMVPVAPLIHDRFAYKTLRRIGWEAQFELHKLIRSIFFRGSIGVGFDISWGEGWGEEERLLEEKDGRKVYEQIIKTPLGNLTSKVLCGMIPHDPLVSRRVEYFIKNKEDYKIYQAYLAEWLARAKPNLGQIEEAYHRVGEEGVASVAMGGAYSWLGDARGMQNLLLDLYDYPELVEELMETILEIKRKEVQAFLDSPAEVLYYDVCWATGSRMSPEFFEKWAIPDMQMATEMVRAEEGKYIGFYTLGKMRAILPMIVDLRPHYIETFEPNEGDITLKEAKEKYGDRVCIMGNYDCVILARGTVEEARQETLRCLGEGMSGGGYVMVTGDEVPADAKIENLKVMVETVEEYGRY